MSNTSAFLLNYALESARKERKTGNLHIYAGISGSLKNALLVIRSGELVGCNYLDKVGRDAVRVLLDAVVVKAMFIKRDISEFTPHQELPSIEDILSELHSTHSIEPATNQTTQSSTLAELSGGAGNLRRAAKIFAPVIGEDKAMQELLEITKQYSPDDDAEEFVKACIDCAATYVGEPTAKMLLAPLLQTLKTNVQPIQAEGKAMKVMGGDLQGEVVSIFENFYGAKAASKVDAIAKECSPRKRPSEFLDKCESFVAEICGDTLAKKMFTPLFEKVGNG